ncbi:MAG: hypothetical protein ABIQ18_25700 [Umezawaea sp.]
MGFEVLSGVRCPDDVLLGESLSTVDFITMGEPLAADRGRRR